MDILSVRPLAAKTMNWIAIGHYSCSRFGVRPLRVQRSEMVWPAMHNSSPRYGLLFGISSIMQSAHGQAPKFLGSTFFL